ncbi:hypothetical protein [Mucilaginibacter sp. UR6-11]|nr:hypothetical protein [Mucilaginibacter sp. UR6-11]MCC8425553.1 hypothetical protein [Mucilaginibacter sp. UR6-11]
MADFTTGISADTWKTPFFTTGKMPDTRKRVIFTTGKSNDTGVTKFLI